MVDVPGNLYDLMPPETYCRCGQTWVGEAVAPANMQVSLRIQCVTCGSWTDSVPGSEK